MRMARYKDVDVHLSSNSTERVEVACGYALVSMEDADLYGCMHERRRQREIGILILVRKAPYTKKIMPTSS